MFKAKKGVSLITVLLFMLIATIAATATFKWLTSENRSSATRMLRQEAYQSAVAGIDNARAWMSSHANEVGAMIKQYFDNDKRPIHLNPVLQQINRASQNYDIWLTGVDADKTTFKLKILAKGNSRNGTAHTEAAIIRVDGLYRIKVPQSSENFSFNKAFHGASTGITGNDTIGSGNINGDWKYSNTPVIKGDMIVTGNTEYGGNVNHSGDFYLAGNMINTAGQTTYGTEGVDTSTVYIGGNVDCPDFQPITVHGDLFIKGNVNAHCKLDVKGNLTIGGMITRSSHHNVNVGKNWVFTDEQVDHIDLLRSDANNTNFSVKKNLYLPYKVKAHCSEGDNCGDNDGRRTFKVEGKVYQYDSDQFVLQSQDRSDYPYAAYMQGYTKSRFATDSRCSSDRTNCKQARLFSFDAYAIASERVKSWSETDDVLKNVSDNYWAQINKMNKYGRMISTTTKTIPEPILIKNESTWKSAKANSFCGIGDQFYIDNQFVKNLNMCYTNAKTQNKLYNDEYLIIEWRYQEHKDVTEKLEGKFVFYVTNTLGNTALPPTKEGSYVFLYLEHGANGQLQGHHGLTYNYLIYSKDDIAEINGLHIKGSVVMADGKSLNKYQGGNNLEFDGNVLKSLASAGIIKENPKYTKLYTGSDEEDDDDEGSTTISATVYDTHYIATSSQLGITLESQYESKEAVASSGEATAQAISPAVLILPRVIYITRNPDGRLSDYYNVINLNGAHEQKDPTKVSCNPTLNTYGQLYQNGTLLSEDVYTCNYQTNDYGTIPFYVVASGETGATPKINMSEPLVDITTSSILTISADVEETSHAQEASIDISVSGRPDGWTITPVTGTSLTLRESSDIEKVYTLTFRPNTSKIDLFTVTTTATAKQGSVYIYLRSPMKGCTIRSPSETRVIMTGYVTVERGSISQYCSKNENSQICSEKGYDKKVNYLDCEDLVSGEWVKASGTNVSVLEQNNRWSVATNTTILLKDQNNVPEYCELLLPTANNSILQAEKNGEYTLYASLKRKRYTLTVKTKDELNSDSKVTVWYGESQSTYRDGTSSICERNSDGDLECNVYAGWYVKTSYTASGSDKFSRWECSGDNCTVPSTTSKEYELRPISANNTITAIYNDKDNHCFYEDFTDLTAFCSGNETNCINTCEGNENSSCTVSGANADWQLMYPNNGSGSSIAPHIQNGYITANNSMQKGTSTIILSTKEAGIHGTMTTMIQTTILENRNKSLNSGFIFSSDATASSFTILNIYGDASNNKALTARLCEGTNSSTTVSHINCQDEVFKDASSHTVSISSENMIKLEIELTIENKLNIRATVNGNVSTVNLDISSYLKSRDEHSRYVGFNVSDPSFKMYDIGWSSTYFADECFENPKVNCSFAANYLGGRVPKDRDVTPWVGLSSWFEDHNCTLSYYYNGCDNATGNSSYGCTSNYFNRDWLTTWFSEHGQDGTYFGASLDDKIYNFSEEGVHGTSYTYYGRKTTINDAKVKISCTDKTSLNGTWTSCGTFHVGEIDRCSQNAEILNSTSAAIYGYADQELEIPVNDNNGVVNLRSSTLWIDISDFSENLDDKIVLYLKDSDGNLSIPRELISNGLQSFDVDVMSNVESFNPQTVQYIVLKSSLSSYKVNTILSSCPYALNLLNCRASYNGISWKLTSTITNIEGAASNGCSVTEDNEVKLSEVSCPENGIFTFNEEGLYNQVNNSMIPVTKTFVIKAKSIDSSEVSCITEPVTISPIQTTCSVAETQTIKGAGMPTLTFSFEGCPYSTCDYTLSIEDIESVSGTSSGESGTWTPQSNKSVALTNHEYTYYATVMGVRTDCGTVSIEDASEAQISNCQLTGEGPEAKFTADVTPATDGSNWSIEVVLIDPNGVVITDYPSTSKTGKGTKYESKAHPIEHLPAGTYYAYFRLNGDDVSTCSPIPMVKNGVSSSSSATPESSSSSQTTNSDVKCAFSANPVAADGQAVYFRVTSPTSFSKKHEYEVTGPNNFSAGQWVDPYNSIEIWMSKDGKVPPQGTYTLRMKDISKTLCSVELKTTNKAIEDCKVNKTNVLTGSKLTVSAKYNGGRCYNAKITLQSPYYSESYIPCTLDGLLSEEFYASNASGTQTYTLSVNGDPQATCSIDVTTKGSTIKFTGGNEWYNTSVACNDSLFVSVDDGNRELVCKSNSSETFTITGVGIGSAQNTCSNGNCSTAHLGLCVSGSGKCERVIRTSACHGNLSCWIP